MKKIKIKLFNIMNFIKIKSKIKMKFSMKIILVIIKNNLLMNSNFKNKRNYFNKKKLY